MRVALKAEIETAISQMTILGAPRDILDTIAKAGAKFKSLADAWADTITPHGELMVTVLAGLATFERHPIKARTDEGRKRAQA
jgi:DNA invertase Pin-like site-specific DNA recombinase